MKDFRITNGYDKLNMTCQGCYEQNLKLGLNDSNRNLKPIFLIVAEIDIGSVNYKEKTLSFYCMDCANAFLERLKGEWASPSRTITLPWDEETKAKYLYKLTQEEREKYFAWETARRETHKTLNK